jgi:2-oxoglutarate/2-oxoacid ferredoxin oxidoreductase subunit alpha
MKVTNITWRIGGEAGCGIPAAGNIFSRTFSKKGYSVIDHIEYPLLVKGGHSTYISRLNSGEIFSLNRDINILAALDQRTIEMHQDEVIFSGYVIYDGEKYRLKDKVNIRKDINYISVPFQRITAEQGLLNIMISNIALGASLALIDYNVDNAVDTVKDVLSGRERETIEMNSRALEFGYKYIREKLKIKAYELEIVKPDAKLLVTGNDAVFLAGVRSGCKFYAECPAPQSYPIHDSFAAVEDDFNIVARNSEDEIEALNMAIGASFAGVRTMVTTSGAGFSLMGEGLGCAAITETPVVIVLLQRPAPAAGLPTWTEQGDMLFSLYASNGEFPRVVIAPGDPEECFYLTGRAFSIAEKYQIPVIIILDKYLSESHFTFAKFDMKKIKADRESIYLSDRDITGDYFRYNDTGNGISPRPVAGLKKGMHIANSEEHDRYGFSEEDAHNRKRMADKRFRKVGGLLEEIQPPVRYGPVNADMTIWGWGSSKGPVLEAIRILNSQEKKVNFIHFTYLYPFDREIVEKYINESSKNVIVENNKTAQLSKLIALYTGYRIGNKILKYSGRQFLPEEIVESIEKIE